MRDGRVRRTLKLIARAHFVVNRVAQRAVGRPHYRLGGDCRRCAKCCEAPSMRVGRWLWHLRTLRRLFLWWQQRVNGFVLVERHARERLFVFRCTHFDPVSRACDSYESRPGMCRDYPRGLLDQAHPELLPGCGYRPIARNAESMLRELRRRQLGADRLVELKRKLFLE